MRTAFLWAGFAALLACGPALAAAREEFPARSITIVMGASKGGITDVATRIYAKAVSRDLGQPIVIDNRPTDAGSAAAAFVQKAAPDGYTLLAFQGAQHAAIPAIQNAPYEPVKGFSPVTLMFDLANFLAVPDSSPAYTVAGLLRLGSENQGGLTFGSSGLGTNSHLTAARLSLSATIPVTINHYAGAAAMIAELVSNRLDFTLVSYAVAKPYVQTGRIRLLAVDANSRWPALPDIPTLREAGIDQPKVASWFGLAAPAGTPAAIVRRLNAAFAKAARDPAVIKGVQDAGAIVTVSSPEEMGKMMVREAAETTDLVRLLGLKKR